MFSKPIKKPGSPFFSSGPCNKRPGWNPNVLSKAILGRSHRSKVALGRIQEVLNLTRDLLNIPKDYRIGIVPASDTGAIEMALWSLLGSRPIDILAWESFGKTWVNDILKQLRLKEVNVFSAKYGEIPDLKLIDFNNDVVFTWNGTTSGVCVPNGDWINNKRKGLTICDATSAVFSMKLPWNKLDVTTYSWQKVLGGEGQHGIIILSPKAIERLETYIPDWPIPKIFQLVKSGKVDEKLFLGNTINTPSMLCVEDVLDSLKWVKKIGGLDKTIELSKKNLQMVDKWVNKIPWLNFLCKKEIYRSCTSICLIIDDEWFNNQKEEDKKDILKNIVFLLEKEDVAYDIASYRDAPVGIRIWGGATVDSSDISLLMSWLQWSFEKIKTK